MMWFYAFLFFLIFCIYFMFIIYVYSKILMAVSNKKSLVSDLIGIIVYILMIPFFAAPLIIGSEINGYRELISKNNYYFIFNLVFFALSLLPGIFIFNKYYLKQAKRRNFRY
ncbi:hypothetical protein F957_02434 [Acinetobacter gyllenbergii CIP 110306 = MTCC 11365]|uniref:Uncharacterized protein n=1 Tax=Acinetobacter gyllenbergii CIP 110306 = MTCC 11365 TaxID=1217657 RepID=A0A829HEP5_9GAMM|nr:hypothetical protein F957_02434 [Acinetobacter gyllenbergii CIP 110306 = MTCC 11365]